MEMGFDRFVFTIRPAAPHDAAAIAGVHVSSWQTTYPGIIDDFYLDRLSHSERTSHWLGVLNSPSALVLVAEIGNEVVGFVQAGRNQGEHQELKGEIFAIYLLEKAQRRGVGRQLFQTAVDALVRQEVHNLILWVLRDNPNRPFYEALGGELIGEGIYEVGKLKLPKVAYGWKEWK